MDKVVIKKDRPLSESRGVGEGGKRSPIGPNNTSPQLHAPNKKIGVLLSTLIDDIYKGTFLDPNPQFLFSAKKTKKVNK